MILDSISVVIPLYNKEGFICSCISSVANQTCLPAMLIVVDDGSSDDSYKCAETALEAYPGKSILVRQGNSGVSTARNKGVSLVSTEYVSFLDADDLWDPTFLERIHSLISDYPDASLYCLGHRVNNQTLGKFVPVHGCSAGFRGIIADYFEASIRGSVANSSKVAIRRSALLAFGGFPEGATVGEDLFVWMKLALSGDVACDSFVAVTVNQVDDNSRHSRRGQIPYPINYYCENADAKRMLSRNAKRYLNKIYVPHLAEYIRVRDYGGVSSLVGCYFKINPLVAVASLLLLLMPPSFLLLIKKQRKRLAETFF